MKKEITIGSRESRLAVIQSEQVQAWIQKAHPELSVQILTMKTTGDIILNQALEKVGGKGLFVKELDRALVDGRSDLSVHSLKELPKELPLLAFSPREDPRDVLVLPEGVTKIDFSKPIGCSSKRRMLQFARLYPQATFATIRGNVQTRLRRLDEGEFSATLLAAAGLKRLGLTHRISRYFTEEEMIPAAGQGILAVQGRAGEDMGFLADFNDPVAEACAYAERSFVRHLDGGCSDPIAAHAIPDVGHGTLRLLGFFHDEKSGSTFREEATGSIKQAEALGAAVAGSLRRAEDKGTRRNRKDQEDVCL